MKQKLKGDDSQVELRSALSRTRSFITLPPVIIRRTAGDVKKVAASRFAVTR